MIGEIRDRQPAMPLFVEDDKGDVFVDPSAQLETVETAVGGVVSRASVYEEEVDMIFPATPEQEAAIEEDRARDVLANFTPDDPSDLVDVQLTTPDIEHALARYPEEMIHDDVPGPRIDVTDNENPSEVVAKEPDQTEEGTPELLTDEQYRELLAKPLEPDDVRAKFIRGPGPKFPRRRRG